MDTYKIVRFYSPAANKENEVVKEGLTLEEAREHCNDPDSQEPGQWFDGYQAE